MRTLVFFPCLFIVARCAELWNPEMNAALSYLQAESSAISSAKQQITLFLRSQNIPIGEQPKPKVRDGFKVPNSGSKLRVALSKKSNVLECRVALGRAPIGSKCIAPCGCTGSQQWIQFSELNRLRRKDPSQWKICQTCQKPFDYDGFATHGGIQGNALSAILDNNIILRVAILSSALASSWLLNLDKLSMRLLVSKLFWQQYPHWSRLIHLPLFLKFWGLKMFFQYVASYYLVLEKYIALQLTELETQLIEPNLPITVDV